ncbi:MAG: ABC transporter permease [Sumerlaeia bacterium]
MSLLSIAWRYLLARPLVSILTIIGVALGSALISLVLTIRTETQRTFLNESYLFDSVVGAKGSPLQMVLSSIYHLDVPTGNIPESIVAELQSDFRVERAVPIGLGDNYKGFRIVGTVPEMFQVESNRFGEQGTEEKFFQAGTGALDLSSPFNAVLGSVAAQETGLRVGDTFVGSHGLVALQGSEEHDEFPYTVVGILKPTNTSQDKAIFSSLDATWQVHDAEKALHESLYGSARAANPSTTRAQVEGVNSANATESSAEPTALESSWAFAPAVQSTQREVTAVLIQLKSAGLRFQFAEEITESTSTMAAIPIQEIQRLYINFLSPMERTLLIVAYLVVVVAVLSILTSLYQAGERRRRDVAILRCLGAHPSQVFLIVLFEALLISLLGVALGWLVAHGGLVVFAHEIRNQLGFGIRPFVLNREELFALSVVLISGMIAGLGPSFMAYKGTPVVDLQRGN